ncbi:MAG: HlyD family efflux transporter periplasmic adaptor subunit, partial [Chloroflexota bacterium]
PVDGPRRFDLAAEPTLVPTSQAVAKPIYTIEQGEVVEILTFQARVSPRLETAVLAPNTGRILSVDVQEGQFVTEGERIAQYDFSELEEELQTLQAAINENDQELEAATSKAAAETQRAELELEIAQLNLELAQEDSAEDESGVSESQIRLLELELELAQAKLNDISASIDPDRSIATETEELEGLISSLQLRMAFPSIVAPTDGVVLGLSISRGNSVNADQNVAIIGQMGSLDDVSIASNLRTEQLELLTTGMSAQVVFSSQPEKEYSAEIVRLPYPYNSGGTDLGFDEADPAVRLLPEDPQILDEVSIGELVDVALILDENNEALWLPPEAIREFSGRTFVVVKDGEREQRVDIEVGLAGNGRIEVLGNVQAGDQVIGP